MLIQPNELAAALGAGTAIAFDCRHDLMDPGAGRRAWQHGHVPGARFAHLDEDLSGPLDGRSGRHPLPDPNVLAARLRAWGVDDATRVVAYDAHGGSFAARLWWLMRWLGHANAAVLDGGWQAWTSAGLPVELVDAAAAAPVARPGNFTRRPAQATIVSAEEVERIRQDPGWLLLDARAPERYSGAVEPIDPVAGHVPGAVNRPWAKNVDGGRFRPPQQLREEFDALRGARDARKIVAMCGSGVTACHQLLALELAGLPGAALYAGSWSGWISDRGRPVATGSA